MKRQAGERTTTGEPSVEQLLAAAKVGRSKFDALSDDIDRLRAGRVTLRAIVAYLISKGIKAEVGELGQWLKRRRNRNEKLAMEANQLAVLDMRGQLVPVREPASSISSKSTNASKVAATDGEVSATTSVPRSEAPSVVARQQAWERPDKQAEDDFVAEVSRQAAALLRSKNDARKAARKKAR